MRWCRHDQVGSCESRAYNEYRSSLSCRRKRFQNLEERRRLYYKVEYACSEDEMSAGDVKRSYMKALPAM